MKTRPKSSPYSDTFITIRFADRDKIFLVPRVFLQDQKWLFDSDEYDCVGSEKVGHTIIHFLYTGEYQILEIEETDIKEDKTRAELRIAIQVHLALGRWELPGLQALVKPEIESLSKALPIFDILQIVDEELENHSFRRSPQQEEWLKVFLTTSLDLVLEKEITNVNYLSLFDDLKYTHLIKYLATYMLKKYYSEKQVQKIESLESDSISLKTLSLDVSSGNMSEISYNENDK